ncbi:MAG: hypothetical protein COB59_11775 [Rhodospirillaceae bacterium]|nr:MAG: hypothetical protein COB59_11775 [Rhodospirillaceae bacterium]
MGVANRIDALRVRHHELDEAIEMETTRACPDEHEIHTLKKEKLRIKDELTTLS